MTKQEKEIKKLREDLTVPNIIKSQLYGLDANAMGCWGSNNFRGSGAIDPEHNGQLLFDISNLKEINQGTIKINLNYSDTYDLWIYGDNKKLIEEYRNIYFDQLTDIIGEVIGY